MAAIAKINSAARISNAQGAVTIERQGMGTHAREIQLTQGDTLYASDTIKTQNTSVELTFADGSIITVGPHTTIAIREFALHATQDPSFVIDLTLGVMRTITGKVVEQNPDGFKLVTPHATVGIRGTTFLAKVNPDTTEEFLVIRIEQSHNLVVTSHLGQQISLFSPNQGALLGNDADRTLTPRTFSPEDVDIIVQKIFSAVDVLSNEKLANSLLEERLTAEEERISIEDERKKHDEESTDKKDQQAQDEADAPPDDTHPGNFEDVYLLLRADSLGEENALLLADALADAGIDVTVDTSGLAPHTESLASEQQDTSLASIVAVAENNNNLPSDVTTPSTNPDDDFLTQTDPLPLPEPPEPNTPAGQNPPPTPPVNPVPPVPPPQPTIPTVQVNADADYYADGDDHIDSGSHTFPAQNLIIAQDITLPITISGDKKSMDGGSVITANDSITGQNMSDGTLVGDMLTMSGGSLQAGDDVITLQSKTGGNSIYGDVKEVTGGDVHFGDDTITILGKGGDFKNSTISGDAGTVDSVNAHVQNWGDDTIFIGGDVGDVTGVVTTLYGDAAAAVPAHTDGGNDTITVVGTLFQGGVIDGGGGDDSISVGHAEGRIVAGAGADTVDVHSVAGAHIDLGDDADKDSLYLTTDPANAVPVTIKNFDTGTDELHINGTRVVVRGDGSSWTTTGVDITFEDMKGNLPPVVHAPSTPLTVQERGATSSSSSFFVDIDATDPNMGDTLSYSVKTQGTYGDASVWSRNEFRYALNNSDATVDALTDGETLNDSFVVLVTDDKGATTEHVVNVIIEGTNDAPRISISDSPVWIHNESLLTSQSFTGTITATDPDFRTGDADPTFALDPNDPTITQVVGTYGTLTISPSAQGFDYEYITNPNALNPLTTYTDETFTIYVTDAHGDTATQTLRIAVDADDDRPVVTLSAPSVSVNETTTTPVTGVATATDIDTPGLTFTYVVTHEHGNYSAGAQSILGKYGTLALTANADGTVTYTYTVDPQMTLHLSGSSVETDTFIIHAHNGLTGGQKQYAQQEVTITVNGVDSAPILTINNTHFTLEESDIHAYARPIELGGQAYSYDPDYGVHNKITYSLALGDTTSTPPSGTTTPPVTEVMGTCGTLRIDDYTGQFTYTADETKLAALASGQRVEEIFTLYAQEDGGLWTAHVITVTVTADAHSTITYTAEEWAALTATVIEEHDGTSPTHGDEFGTTTITIHADLDKNVDIVGDAADMSTGHAGDDVITVIGNMTHGRIIGDTVNVEAGDTVTAGSDKILVGGTLSNGDIYADAVSVENGVSFGGDDNITVYGGMTGGSIHTGDGVDNIVIDGGMKGGTIFVGSEGTDVITVRHGDGTGDNISVSLADTNDITTYIDAGGESNDTYAFTTNANTKATVILLGLDDFSIYSARAFTIDGNDVTADMDNFLRGIDASYTSQGITFVRADTYHAGSSVIEGDPGATQAFGNSRLYVGSKDDWSTSYIYGDAQSDMNGQGSDDTIIVAAHFGGAVFGDTGIVNPATAPNFNGGDDEIIMLGGMGGSIAGDATLLADKSSNTGHDTISTHDEIYMGNIVGDVLFMNDHSHSEGNDSLYLQSDVHMSYIFGDATHIGEWMVDANTGAFLGASTARTEGDDSIIITGVVNDSTISGDAEFLYSSASTEGHDNISIHNNINTSAIYGDAIALGGEARDGYGNVLAVSNAQSIGNDTIAVMGNVDNSGIFGDVAILSNNATSRGHDVISVDGYVLGMEYPYFLSNLLYNIQGAGVSGDSVLLMGNAGSEGNDVVTINGNVNGGILLDTDTRHLISGGVYGDAALVTENATSVGDDDIIINGDVQSFHQSSGTFPSSLIHSSGVYGDAGAVTGNADTVGNDSITINGDIYGGTFGYVDNVGDVYKVGSAVYGDAGDVTDNATATGDDVIIVNGDILATELPSYRYYNNEIGTQETGVFGDAGSVTGNAATEGHDSITINGDVYGNEYHDDEHSGILSSGVFGDTGFVTDNARSIGNDSITITGNVYGNEYYSDYDDHNGIFSSGVFGDAGFVADNASSTGDDTIHINGTVTGTMRWHRESNTIHSSGVFGDAGAVTDNGSTSGHDTISINGNLYALENDPMYPGYVHTVAGAVYGDVGIATDNATVVGNDSITINSDIYGGGYHDYYDPLHPDAYYIPTSGVFGDAGAVTGNASTTGDDIINITGDIDGDGYYDPYYPPWDPVYHGIHSGAVFGDAGTVQDNATTTGHDSITINGTISAGVYGDTFSVTHNAQSEGNDKITITGDIQGQSSEGMYDPYYPPWNPVYHTIHDGGVVVGDAERVTDNAGTKGDDTITIHGDIHGGAPYADWDPAYESIFSGGAIYGDAGTVTGNGSTVGNDIISINGNVHGVNVHYDSNNNILVHDIIQGGAVFGDAGMVTDNASITGDDTISIDGNLYGGELYVDNYYHDWDPVFDSIHGAAIYGDAGTITGNTSSTGNDTITVNGNIEGGEFYVDNYYHNWDPVYDSIRGAAIYGDAGTITGNASSTGNDTITVNGNVDGGEFYTNNYHPWDPVHDSIHGAAIYGDAREVRDEAIVMGDDTINVTGDVTGALYEDYYNHYYTASSGAIYGDAHTVTGNASTTGHDNITIGGKLEQAHIYGDAQLASGADVYDANGEVTHTGTASTTGNDSITVNNSIYGSEIYGDTMFVGAEYYDHYGNLTHNGHATATGNDSITINGDVTVYETSYNDGVYVYQELYGSAIYGEAALVDGNASAKGDDTITINGNVYGSGYGNMYHHPWPVYGATGGIYGDAGEVVGDASTIGNDTMTVHGDVAGYEFTFNDGNTSFNDIYGSALYGDAAYVSDNATTMGDDKITVHGSLGNTPSPDSQSSGSQYYNNSAIYGDVAYADGSASVEGDDIITLTEDMLIHSDIYGDAESVSGTASTTGNDTITIKGDMYGGSIYGDAANISTTGTATGNDKIYIKGLMSNGHIDAGAGDDIIIIGSPTAGQKDGMTGGIVYGNTGQDVITIHVGNAAQDDIQINVSDMEDGDIIELYDLIPDTDTHVTLSGIVAHHAAGAATGAVTGATYSAGSFTIDGEDVTVGIGDALDTGQMSYVHDSGLIVHFR